MNKQKINIGTIRVWITRLTSYLSLFNFIMLIYLSLILEEPFGIGKELWLILLIIIIPTILFIDIKYIFPKAQDYAISKTPEWVRVIKQIDAIAKKLGIEGDE